MASKIQVRRGTTAQRTAVTLDSGEPGWDTDLEQLFMGDGATAGGKGLAMDGGLSTAGRVASVAAAGVLTAALLGVSGITGGALDIAATLTDDRTLTLPDQDVTVSTFGASLIDDASATAARSTLGLGTIASQDATAVDIDGGAIDGTTLGATTPAAATVTTLTASGTISADTLDSVAGGGIDFSGEDLTNVGDITASGDITIDSTGAARLKLDRSGANDHYVGFFDSGTLRWLFGQEAAGNDFIYSRFNSSGVFQDVPLKITAADGYIIAANLPTSSAGLPTGALWDDSGTVKVA